MRVFQWKRMINYQDTPSSGNIVIMIAQETRTDKTNSSINQSPPSHHRFLQSLKLCIACASTEHHSKPTCIWFWLKMPVALLHISVHNIIDLICTQAQIWWALVVLWNDEIYIVYYIQNDVDSKFLEFAIYHAESWLSLIS